MRLQVLVPKKPEFKGKMIEVDIYEAGKHYMKGPAGGGHAGLHSLHRSASSEGTGVWTPSGQFHHIHNRFTH